MSTSLEGVSLHVADVERSIAFYTRIPGAQVVMHHPGRFAKFKFGDAHIQVVAVPPGEKSFHIELNAADLNTLYDDLKTAGLEPNGRPAKQFFGRTQFQMRDPDGNVLEFDTP